MSPGLVSKAGRRRLRIGALVAFCLFSVAASYAFGQVSGIVMGRRGFTAETLDQASNEVCVDLVDTGSVIPLVGAGKGKPPPARGGKVRNGNYRMTEFVLYGAPAGYQMGTSSATIRLTGDSIEGIAHTKVLFANDLTYGKGAYRINGVTMDMDLTCPSPNHPVSHDYTADGDTFWMYSNERSGDIAYVAIVKFERTSE